MSHLASWHEEAKISQIARRQIHQIYPFVLRRRKRERDYYYTTLDMLLHRPLALRASPARVPTQQALWKQWLLNRSRHVVRFKEGDRVDEQQAADVPQTTDTKDNAHHGHLDPIARSRDALNKLLGRHSHTANIADDVSQPAGKHAQRKSVHSPAFEAPLNVPVFSRRREVSMHQGLSQIDQADTASVLQYPNSQ